MLVLLFNREVATSVFLSGIEMLVHFVTDEASKIAAVRAMLEPQFDVIPQLLGGGETPSSSNGVLMVDADLRQMVRVEQIRLVLQKMNRISEKLFVVQNQVRSILSRPMRSARPTLFRAHEKSYPSWFRLRRSPRKLI